MLKFITPCYVTLFLPLVLIAVENVLDIADLEHPPNL